MMISPKMQEAINNQIKAELDSAYLYLSMSAYFAENNLPGFARWMHVQSQEEVSHAMKFYHFLLERGAKVTLLALDQPSSDFSSPLDIFERTLKHEQKVTQLINNLYELALQEKDYPSQIMLQWFIEEQVEEESNAAHILEMIKMSESKSFALLAIDQQLGKRKAEEE